MGKWKMDIREEKKFMPLLPQRWPSLPLYFNPNRYSKD